jgi:hypothetical protein
VTGSTASARFLCDARRAAIVAPLHRSRAKRPHPIGSVVISGPPWPVHGARSQVQRRFRSEPRDQAQLDVVPPSNSFS